MLSTIVIGLAFNVSAQSLNNGIGVFAAAEMKYSCIGNDKYKVTLEVYAECGYFDGSLNNKDNYPITIKSTSLDAQFDGVLLKPSSNSTIRNGDEINIYCEDESSQCDTRDEASPRGLKKYVFSGDIDLGPWGKADDWVVFWARNNRSEEISTIGDKQPYHSEVRINNKTVCNSSPSFGEGTNAVNSIITICKGAESKTIALNPIDPDGNILRYSIVSPLKGLGDNVLYGSGVSSTKPLGSGSSVSVSNGNLEILSDISADELNGTFDLLTEELNSSGDVIGASRKGFQVSSLTCSNESPVIGEFNDSLGYDITFCAGETIDLTIYATDSDSLDKMRFISDPVVIKSNPLAGKPRFTKDTRDSNPNLKYSSTPEGYFKWTPSASDTGTFTITVTVQDNACPIQGESTQEFVIRVNPIPSFTLGEHRPYECESFLFEPEITHGGNSITYEWKPWGFNLSGDTVLDSATILSTDPSIFVDEPSKLYLVARDDAGCEKADYVDIFKSLDAVGTYERFCVDQITTFRDSSTYRGSSFVSREWTIETAPSVFTDQVFDYAFQDEGFYDVKLVIENDFGCKDSTQGKVPIVPHPELKPAFHDFCSRLDNWSLDGDTMHGVDLKDLTEYALGDSRDTVWWEIKDLSGNIVGGVTWEEELYPDYPFPDSGSYQVRLITKSTATCVDTIFDTIQIIQRPEIDMITDSYLALDCLDPDTVFQAKLDSHFIGTAPIDLYTIDLDKDITTLIGQVSPGDTFEFPVDTTGWYQFRIIDANGCDHYETFTVQFPVFADFAYETACSEGPVQFRDFSYSDTTQRTIIDWKWDFQDGSPIVSGKDPAHEFTSQGDYDVILKVTDSEGCELADTMTVYYSFPTEVFEITPDLQLTKQCVDDTIKAVNYALSIGIPYHIDTIVWTFQELEGAPQEFEYFGYPDPIDVLTYSMANKGLEQIYVFTDTTSSISIKSYMRFNRNPYNRLDTTEGCVVEKQLSESFEILPRFHGDILDNRVCIGDSGIFKFQRDTITSHILVESAYWEFYSAKEGRVIETSTELEPQVFVNQDLVNRGASQLRVEANFVDVNGCDFRDVAIIEVDEVTAKPRWDFGQEICKGQPQVYVIESDQGDVDSWKISLNYNDDLDSGAFIAPTLENPVIGMTSVAIDTTGKFPISVFLIKNVSLENNKICRSRLDDSITVWDIPDYTIEWDTVCSNFPIVFENTSSIIGDFGTVLNYTWDFGDGGTAVSLPGESVEHQYEFGGFYNVTLSATTDKGCNNSSKTFTVYVRPTPEIGFVTDQELEADVIITFIDDSELYGAEPVKTTWDFGDLGYFEYDTVNGSIQMYQEVEWDSVGIYYIKHSVTTSDGCTGFDDSLRIDLNTYLELPNAFSPNGDGVNDGLSLLDKSIRELYTFKIFNRWGQVVFDSEGDVGARWDGTYNGSPQEVGVYVAHVHALGAYDTEFNFKVNVKLVR